MLLKSLFLVSSLLLLFSSIPVETQPIEDNGLLMGNTIIQPNWAHISNKSYYEVIAEVSAYNNYASQTWGDPNLMASGRRVFEGAIACPSWLEFGTIVEINGRQYVCEDRMNIRYRNGNYFDIFLYSYQEAKQFGRQSLPVIIYR
jgi:3D (Asp-Asp-Asp) domain-containing protein